MTRWTADQTARVKALWLSGRSAGEIEALMACGLSRCAIIGKLYRLKLMRRGDGKRTRSMMGSSRYDNSPQLSAGRLERALGLRPGVVRAPKFSKTPIPPPDPVPEQTVSLQNLEDHHCRWIYGDVGSSNWGFCGQERETGSYCAQHTKRAYTGSYVPSRAIQNADLNWKIARAKKETEEVGG